MKTFNNNNTRRKHLSEMKTQLIHTQMETIFDLENKIDNNNPTTIKAYIDEVKQLIKNPQYELTSTDSDVNDNSLFIKQNKLIYAQKALLLCKQFLYKEDEMYFTSYITSIDIKKEIENDKHQLKSQMPNKSNLIDAIENDDDIFTDASVWMRRVSALAIGALLVVGGLLIYKKYKK